MLGMRRRRGMDGAVIPGDERVDRRRHEQSEQGADAHAGENRQADVEPAARSGARSRFAIGITIFAGMAIGTLFTLFVTPAVYTFLARDHAGQMAREKALGHLTIEEDEAEDEKQAEAAQ